MRQARLTQLFIECLELSAEERAGTLDRECGDDLELHHRVSAMLEFDARRPDFLDRASIAELARKALAPFPSLPPRVGRFRVRGRLGEGGTAAVFDVEQDQLPGNAFRHGAPNAFPALVSADARDRVHL